jgi:hypothetical protein
LVLIDALLRLAGDIHLAMFRARKAMFQAAPAETGEDEEQQVDNEVLASVTEETS